MESNLITVGIDTGGTFTDLVLRQGETLRVVKVPSPPEDPGRAIALGLEQLGALGPGDQIIHGTTVALNALLTGRGAPVALVTNAGFVDLIEIGRQERPDIYALFPEKPKPLVPRELRFEIPQRSWPKLNGDGFETTRRPSAEEIAKLAEEIRASSAETIAICLLHAWALPEIETELAAALEHLGLPICTSAGILREHRETERFSTTLVNATLLPLMRDYLAGLGERVGQATLSLLQSNGGTLSAERAAEEPVRVILSGPAGGVVGAAHAVRESGFGAFVGFDMGGTSTDVAFHDPMHEERSPTRALDPIHVGGHPVGVPSLDIHTIGCGGGSLIQIDSGGVLHVGPESAGADPGPVCYGASSQPTLTDAHVLLGHIADGHFLAGELRLDQRAVRAAFERLGQALGRSAEEIALGAIDVARAAMQRALGVMTMQRGQDPGSIPLVAFGGAGGLHAAALAQSLRMPAALIPTHPGALSASGMGVADGIRDGERSLVADLDAWDAAARARLYGELEAPGLSSLLAAGFAPESIHVEHGMDLRYRGQSYAIHIPECMDPARAFHSAHKKLYGYEISERALEIVCLRTRSKAKLPAQMPKAIRIRPMEAACIVGQRSANFGTPVLCDVILRSKLQAGERFSGPALVEEYSGTSLVPAAWQATCMGAGHLLLEPIPD